MFVSTINLENNEHPYHSTQIWYFLSQFICYTHSYPYTNFCSPLLITWFPSHKLSSHLSISSFTPWCKYILSTSNYPLPNCLWCFSSCSFHVFFCLWHPDSLLDSAFCPLMLLVSWYFSLPADFAPCPLSPYPACACITFHKGEASELLESLVLWAVSFWGVFPFCHKCSSPQ